MSADRELTAAAMAAMGIKRHCPHCGAELAIRVRRADGRLFLSCPNWPDCDYTEPIPQPVIMRLAGQPGLFDG